MLLEVEGLSLESDEGIFVPNLSFSIDRGEIVALTGKSGSGKTSIGLAILGLLPKGIRWKEGSIKWSDPPDLKLVYPDDSIKWSSLRGSRIGYVQQDVFGIFDPVIRMGKQMTMIISECARREEFNIESELRSKMTEVGISDIERVWNSYPHQLSGGQLQRCQICLSLVIQPLLLIADEPTSAIDKINQVELLDLLAFVRNKYNMAILCITHEEDVVKYLADTRIDLSGNSDHNTAKIERPEFNPDSSIQPVLEVINLGFTHRFGGLVNHTGAKIQGIGFNLVPGLCLGIIGESGSGKSTLAKLLVGLLSPSEGSVRLNNHLIDFSSSSEIRLLRSKVQLVMQDGRGSLHPNKTIRWLFEEVLEQRQKKEKDLKANLDEVLTQVGLPLQILDRREASLSGGECLRVCIARALLMQPEVLICDESTTSLDDKTKEGILDLLVSLMKNQKLALILISHDEDIIRRFANEILVFEKGEIVEQGEKEVVINYPNHPATKKIFAAHATLSSKK